jgi:hypothetical protein
MEYGMSQLKILAGLAALAALSGLAGCGSGNQENASGDAGAQAAKALFAPAVKVKGEVLTAGGDQANGCVLEIYNVVTGELVRESTISGRFSIMIQDGSNMDGLRFRGLCDGTEVYRSADYPASRLADMNWRVSLGKITVARGLVTVSGRVVDDSGTAPRDCSVGVYPAGKKEPLETWPASGDFHGEFDLADAGNLFTIEASCPGYAKRGTSGVYGPQMVDSDTNSIRTRDLVVQK